MTGDPVIYDNEAAGDDFADPTTEISGGSIVIHKGGKAGKAGDEIASGAQAELPADYELFANYPNPFNPQTTIVFALPETGHVILSIHDMLGRRVRKLLDTDTEAGKHSITFDAQSLPSGVYVYRLHTVGGTFTRTMLLLK